MAESEFTYLGKNAAAFDVYQDRRGGLVVCKPGEKPDEVIADVQPFKLKMLESRKAMTSDEKVARMLKRNGLTLDDFAAVLKAK